MNSYVIRFVSVGRKRGKTSIATQVVSELVGRGYVVGVVKHSGHRVDVVGKDSSRYVSAGAKSVLISSREMGVVFLSGWVDDLEYSLRYLNTPVVVVEGFKESGVGDAVAVVKDLREFQELSEVTRNLVAVVSGDEEVRLKLSGSLRVFREGEANMLTDFIEARLLDFLENQTPRTNCGYCGYGSCRALVKAYATGKTLWCPVKSDVSLTINDKPIPMNPFVKNVLRGVVEGFISSLKGVDQRKKKVVIELNY